MENQVTGAVTRSKAAGIEQRPGVDIAIVARGKEDATCASSRSRASRLSHEALDHDNTCVPAVPRGEENASCLSGRSRSSRQSLKVQRRRAAAEYKAQEELVKLKEQLIRKKLALEIAEIEEEGSDHGSQSVYSHHEKVDEWLRSSNVPSEHVDVQPMPTAPADTCGTDVIAREHSRGLEHASHTATSAHVTFAPAASSSPPSKCARVIPPETITPGGPTAPSDIMHLADAIITTMTKHPRQNYDLPVFDGSPVDWMAYRRAYEATAPRYSTYENTVRLQASLRGAAKCAVEGLLRTGSEPTDVIEALEEEFGHPNLLLETALNKIRSLPRVSDSGVELRNITCVVRNCVYMLRNIKAEGYINNPQLTHEILSKLTHVQRAQYGEFVMVRNVDSKEDLRVSPNINMLLDFLSHLSRASAYYLPLNMNTEQNNNRNRTTAPANPAGTRAAKFRALAGCQDFTSRREPAHRVHITSEEAATSSASSQASVCALCNSAGHRLPECGMFINKSEKEKWDFVKDNKLCFKCLVKTHPRYVCRAKRCDKCYSSHHTLLHYEKSTGPGDAAAIPPMGAAAHMVTPLVRTPSNVSAAVESVTSMGEECKNTKTLLKIVPVNIIVNNVAYSCYALLDDGATVSLIDSSVCQFSGPSSPLKIVSAGGKVIIDKKSCRVTARIRGPNGVCHDISLRTIDNLDLPTQSMSARVIARNKHLRDLDCCEMSCAKPMILIGQDNWQLIVNQQIRQGKSGQPVASLTKLGWVVHGPVGIYGRSGQESVNLVSDNLDELSELVKQQFLLESIGIVELSRKNVETERACKVLDCTSRRVDGRWEVGLLWSRDAVHLPDNYDYAVKRLRGIEGKMDKNPDYAESYNCQIERLISEGYARRLETPLSVNPVWHLPHFGVTNPNKPNKLRLVYDAAAKYKGVCLNDYLLTGPDLLNSLLGVLFKFRSGPIAFTADIADMFLRIKIRKEDQGAQLFLWRGRDRVRDPDTYVMDSMIFGAKSSPASAIHVLNKNATEFRDRYPKAVKAIHENHYMDDYLDSVESLDSARQLIKDVSAIHSAGGFSIRGWVTNSPELRNELPAVVPGTINFDKSPYSGERTLGMIWVPESDELAFDLSFKKVTPDVVEGRVIPTKRQFLRFIMSIFDPLGLLYPYTIKSKILLQKVWKSGIGWDDQLKEDEFKEWENWLHDIKQLSNVRVPRWYKFDLSAVELHVFGDAGESAYSAVAYLVGRDGFGQSIVSLVIGKARVAPLKVISVPRLELQAAVLACRLACTVVKEQGLKITRKYLWSDSKTVLKWVHSDPRDFQKFVSHRLAEIDRKSSPSEWRWVPSAENPADEATKLHWPTNCKLWFTGPAFLYQDKDQWPVNEYEDAVDTDLERLEKVHSIKQYVPLFNVDRFASWTRAIRAAGRVLAFLGISRKNQIEKLSVSNVRDAEILLLRQCQVETFPKEMALLKTKSTLPADSKIRELDPFLYEGDGLLRVRGRLSAAPELMFDEKYPIILDGRSHTARLIALEYHKRAHHANTETVINSIREKYWLTQVRRTVKYVVSKCQLCRVRRARPSLPKMGDLPAARLVNTRRAFVHCGVDYFGPMDVSIGRRREKRWGVIFTCLVTRGVHLELAASLSADSAIMAIRRFIARRGQPSIMFSDRGTNFVGADAELKAAIQAIESDKIRDFAVTKGISWQFNPPAAPHMGGCWERLVRSVKTALKVTLSARAPKEELLFTLMAEVEMTINSRPLTFVGADPDGPIALTPNHLLIGTATGASTLGTFDASDLTSRKAWIKAQALADMFWRRWLKEYVPTLQKRQKWLHEVPPVKVGDMVLILEENQPRNAWPRGVISAVHPGRDGQIRVVTIRTNRGSMKRPVVKIIVLPTDECVQEQGGGM